MHADAARDAGRLVDQAMVLDDGALAARRLRIVLAVLNRPLVDAAGLQLDPGDGDRRLRERSAGEERQRQRGRVSQAAMLRKCESRMRVKSFRASLSRPGSASSKRFTAQRSPVTRKAIRCLGPLTATALSWNSPVAWL